MWLWEQSLSQSSGETRRVRSSDSDDGAPSELRLGAVAASSISASDSAFAAVWGCLLLMASPHLWLFFYPFVLFDPVPSVFSLLISRPCFISPPSLVSLLLIEEENSEDRKNATLCCYHSNCITAMSQWCLADMRACSLPPLAALRLKLTSEKNKEKLERRGWLFSFHELSKGTRCFSLWWIVITDVGYQTSMFSENAVQTQQRKSTVYSCMGSTFFHTGPITVGFSALVQEMNANAWLSSPSLHDDNSTDLIIGNSSNYLS